MDPAAFPPDRFQRLVDEAVASLPEQFRNAMTNIAIVVEDDPTLEQLAEVGIEPPDSLYGLYEGIPLPDRQWSHGNVLPDKVTLFRRPILEDSLDDEDVVVGIGETLIHEIGHYFGLDEDQIMEIEEKYWRNG